MEHATEKAPKTRIKRPPPPEISLVDKATIQAAFWSAPDNAEFSDDVIGVVLNYSKSQMEKVRTHGTGPRFIKQGQNVLYRKSDVVAWRRETAVEAANGAHAKAMKKAREH